MPLSSLFTGPNGADLSTPYRGFSALGLSADLGVAHAADDFDVPEGPDLYPDSVVVHAYQHGAPLLGGTTITAAFAQIWSGPPGIGTVVAGDLINNRMDEATYAGAYRTDESSPTDESRFIQDLELDLLGMPALPSGSYWLEIALVGDARYGTPTLINSPWPSADDNAVVYDAATDTWDSVIDGQSQLPLSLCFSFFAGDSPSECDADFDGDGTIDTRDFLAYLSAWLVDDVLTEWDQNGVIDTRDVIAFLREWAGGC